MDPPRPDRPARRLRAALCAWLLAAPVAALAAPAADLWERWLAHDPDSTRSIDHGAWSTFLARHVRAAEDGANRVDYAAVGARDRALLDRYVADLSALPISRYRREEQLAYWVNLYNALTVQVVLDHYPVQTIRDISISPGLFSIGPWGRKLVEVEGARLSLDDIEHRILRPIWQDPRIHYAVNCAALGCPDLMAAAFTAENADRLLDRGARAYVNHPRGVRFDGERLVVSSIYEWFQEDFGGDDRAVIEHLRRYAEPSLAERLAGASRIADDHYDWSLNDAGGSR